MKAFEQLLEIMARLRDKENGCPWDLKQNEETLIEYLLEESHEVIEAIEMEDANRLREELGDLLLQIVFLSRINEEKGAFSINDVIQAINRKLIRRHPHIFGNTTVSSASEVKSNWEKIKAGEKGGGSIISDYPDRMPALQTAKRISEQASSIGFDWVDPTEALKKVEEEIEELKAGLAVSDRDNIEEEIGDLLFAVANVARLTGVNPEYALRHSNHKFKKRFRYIEETVAQNNKEMSALSLQELELIWQESKRVED